VRRSLQSVAIVGRDAAAWIAAIGLKRSVGGSGLRVRVVELPSLLHEVDFYAAVPSLGALHKLLGLEEALILREAGGVPCAAQRFSNWARSKAPFMHGYDNKHPGSSDLDFLQYWLKARMEGLRVELEDFSLAASAAKHGRLPEESGSPGPLSASPGYHLNARAYVRLLKGYALHLGVEQEIASRIALDRDGERISAVLIDDRVRLEGDLFIDASGPEGLLIREVPGSDFESWSQWLPCTRMLVASAPRMAPLPAFSQISAFRAGWVGLYPLQDRTGVIACYDQAAFSDAEMLESLPVLSGLAIGGDAVVTPLEPGIRPRSWIGNCIAIGEAAISLEPLDAVQLHLIHVGLSQLVSFFPTDSEAQPEATAYNAAMASYARNIRDFQIAHYKLNRRFDESLWDRAREAPPPASLDHKIKLFESRGIVALYDDESFQEQNWSSVFIGHGLMPRSYDPRVDLLVEQDHIFKVQQRLRDIAEMAKTMPTVASYLGHYEAPQALQAL